MRSRSYQGKDHYAYENEEEFREHHDEPIVYWRDGEEGDWVRCDDGQIAQVLATGNLGITSWVRTPVGFFNRNHHSMKGWAYNVYHYNAGQKNQLLPQDRRFCWFYAQTYDLRKSYILSRPGCKQRTALKFAKKLFRHKIIKDLIVEEIKNRIGEILDPEVLKKAMETAVMVAAKKGELSSMIPFIGMWAQLSDEPSMQIAGAPPEMLIPASRAMPKPTDTIVEVEE